MKDLSAKIQTSRATNFKEKIKNISIFFGQNNLNHISLDTDNWNESTEQPEPMISFRINNRYTKRFTELELEKILEKYLE